MRLPFLESVELEVSDWDPQPTSNAACRALAGELRLYCTGIQTVVLVCDLDRTLVRWIEGTYSISRADAEMEALWKEV